MTDIDKFRKDMFKVLAVAEEFNKQFYTLVKFVAKETGKDELLVFSQMFRHWAATRMMNLYLQENLCLP